MEKTDITVICRETPSYSECQFKMKDNSVDIGEQFYFLRVKLTGDFCFNTDPEENSQQPFTTNSTYPHNLARARGVFA